MMRNLLYSILILEIFTCAKNTSLKVELGGGIRSLDTVEYYLKNGISRVILGSIAVKNPEIVKDAVKNFGDRIAVGIDAIDGMAAAEGWLDKSEINYIDLAAEMRVRPVDADHHKAGHIGDVDRERVPIGLGQQAKCICQKRVAGKQRPSLIKYHVRRRPSAAQFVIIHTRQIVMN